MYAPPGSPGVNQGDLLAGKYRVDKVLGAGGMGVVVAAHHIRLDERVAIKFLLPEMLTNGDAVARFEREARAAVKIKSEHVARVSDVGTLENGAPYMVMEYLDGGDLAAWLKSRGPLSIEQASEFVLQACEAVAEAHSLGIVHRDLKPANLFVIRRPDGALSVKVLDFGISKMRGGGTSVPDISITKTQAMMGSPLYMSPEQMQSAKDVDSRTDIWALGIVLYELVTGESPFTADTMPELVAKILSVPPPPLRARLPHAPRGFEALILRCIEKDRNRRYESVGQLAVDLVPFAPRRSRISLERISGVMRSSGLSANALAPPSSSDPVEQAAGGTQGAWGRTSASGGRGKFTMIALVLALALGVGAYFFFGGHTASEPESSDSLAATPSHEPLEAPEVPAQPATAERKPAVAPAPSPAPAASSSAPAVVVAPVSPARRPNVRTRTTASPVTPKTAPVSTPRAPEIPKPSPPAQTMAPKQAPAPAPKAGGAFDDRK